MTSVLRPVEPLWVLDSAPDPELDALVRDLAAELGVHSAELSIVTPERVWLKAAVHERGTSRRPQDTFCAEVATGRSPVVVPDTSLDPRYADHPATTGPLGIRFYAAAPVRSREGGDLGVLCAWHPEPLHPAPGQLRALEQAARLATALLELQRSRVEQQHDQVVVATTGAVLEMISGGADLHDVLDTIARSVEEVTPDGLCSIMLLDGDVLREGAAPSLPVAYRKAVEGLVVGPAAGSCGTAVHTRAPVVAADIATDPRWPAHADVAVEHGLRSCWSVPIIDRDAAVVGAVAVYHADVRAPHQHELDQLGRWVTLAELAISRARGIAALRVAASRDPLTSLANRPALLRELETRLRGGHGGQVGVLFVDLDRFKSINDTLGHHVGDHFLQVVAERLLACAGPDDLVARFGGDEFVLVTSAVDPAGVEQLGTAVLEALRPPMTALGQTVSVSASIGLATSGAQPGLLTATGLVGDADLAMYDAKSRGRGDVTWFAPVMRERALDRLQIQLDLEAAIGNGELFAVYQPQVEVRSGRVVSVEALLRWHSPTRGDVPPLQFIPLAEECNLIGRVGELVLRQACAQLVAWRADDAAWASCEVWVNVSAHQLADPGFGALVRRTLAETGLPAVALGLEITETSVMGDERQVREVLQDLRDLGVGVAIDDFGIGFSSMSRLKHVPVDVLKIDRTFVTDLATDDIDAQIVAGLLALAGALGLQVVAEGVETEAQRDRLLELGCGWAQGFWWARPLPADELAAAVRGGGAVSR